MSDRLQAYTPGTVVLNRTKDAPVESGGWLSVTQNTSPLLTRDRAGKHSANALFGSKNAPYPEQYSRGDRLLTDQQLWTVYLRTPDVRSAVDAITRRVATWNWVIEPSIDPEDDNHAAALEESKALTKFFRVPNTDGETWQELWTKAITDLMVFDAGVIENVFPGKLRDNGTVDIEGELVQELVALRGSSVFPAVDRYGHLLGYRQNASSVQGQFVIGDAHDDTDVLNPLFDPRQIVFMRLFPNTAGPLGLPIIETIINEVISIIRSSEHTMLAFDADEIPPGILVLTGIAGKAAQTAKSDLQKMRGKDHKMRVITNPDPKATGAHWVELHHTAKDVDFVNVVKQIRRTIWRVFGVLPVEMGASEDIPRAVGQVQLEVAGSHLINPILELIEAKINARILPLVVGEEAANRIRFRFDRESKMSATDKEKVANTYVSLVREGLMSRNEARAKQGQRPVKGGEVVTVTTGQGIFPLSEVVAGLPATVQPNGEDLDEDDPETDGEEQPPGEANTRAHLGSELLPSEWQPRGRFDGLRTLDLGGLHDAVAGYTRAIAPLYEKVQIEAEAALRAHYKQGQFTEDDAQIVLGRISRSLDKMEVEWDALSGPYYKRASALGRSKARDWTGQMVLRDWEERGELYSQNAMSYLTQTGGLTADLRARMQATVHALVAPLQERAHGKQAKKGTDWKMRVSEAVQAVTAAFIAEKHRIKNWAGRLVELANQALIDGLKQGESVVDNGQLRSTEWWVEWVYVGDKRTCSTCELEGSLPIRPMSSLSTTPGGDTECRSKCRCVLVMWTREEVERGDAVAIGGQE